MFQRFLDKLAEPIVTNRGLDFLAFLSWLCFAWWGIASVFSSIPSIAAAATPLYEVIWGGLIGFTALVAAVASISTFFTIPNLSRVIKKQIELSALVLLVGFVSVYPAVVIIQAAAGESTRIAISGIALYYVLFPIWRIIHLNGRIRALITATTGKPFTDATG